MAEDPITVWDRNKATIVYTAVVTTLTLVLKIIELVHR